MLYAKLNTALAEQVRYAYEEECRAFAIVLSVSFFIFAAVAAPMINSRCESMPTAPSMGMRTPQEQL